VAVGAATDSLSSRSELARLEAEAGSCVRCRLSEGRTRVVFGSGDPHADLMLVGEAPGFHEDRQGAPFVGGAGALLDRLLAGIGLSRDDVYLANVLKCRPPGNREPFPDEVEACESHLFRQIAQVSPQLVVALGSYPARLLSGKEIAITSVRGRPEPLLLGGREMILYPLYHPAAALYTPAMLRTLEEDFRQIPALLSGEQDIAAPSATVIPFPVVPRSAPSRAAEQLELF
jgi:uracil-DNA glycosylase